MLNIDGTNPSMAVPYSQSKKPILNKVKKRLLILSPAVAAGLEREACKTDFESLEDKSIGKGGFGSVWKVRHKVTKQIFAIKVINKDSIVKQNMVEQTNREIEIMYRLDHPHIIKLYSHFEDDEDFCLIMQIASKGQLYSIIKRLKRLDQRTAAQYMREVISAIKYLHTRNPPIIHRDIKPENILLDQDGRCKLADFGWSNFEEGNKFRDTYCGTPEYLAPEMVTKSGHNESVDIWALGVLLFEMLTGRTPFNFTGDRIQLFNNIKTLRIVWTDDFPQLAKDLVGRILRLNPKDRLTLDQIINHQWFKDVPIIRPVLTPIVYNERQKLESHLIQSIPEFDKERNVMNKSAMNNNKVVTRIISHNENPIKEANIQQEINNINKNILINGYYNNDMNMNINNPQIVQNDQNNLMPNPNSNILITSQNIISSQKNQIRVDKNQYEKEIKELKDLREDNYIKDNQLKDLRKALEKAKAELMNLKERVQTQDVKTLDLEQKNNKLMKLESENKLLKIDNLKLNKENNILKSKYEEMANEKKEYEIKIRNAENKIRDLGLSKNEEIQNLENKLKEFEDNYINNSTPDININNNTIITNQQKISQLTKNKIEELFSLINNKIPAIENKMMEREQKEIEERKQINYNIDKKINKIVKDFSSLREQFQSKENALLKKQIEELNNENIKLKKKINELKSEKSEQKKILNMGNDTNKDKQIIELKNLIDDLEQKMTLVEENKKVTEEKYKYQRTLANNLNEKIEELRLAKNSYKNFFFASEQEFKKYVPDKNLRELVFYNKYVDPDDIKS